jgi:hypothetical protein
MKELALYIDIEGTSKKFEDGAKQSFISLTNDLFTISQEIYTYLSIIQFGGDGFLLKESLHYDNKILKFIEISSGLLQAITLRGGTGRVQISHGYMSDVSGTYSQKLQDNYQLNKQNIVFGSNRKNTMLINPVIGTSIINCYKLKGPKGPLLLVDIDLEDKLKNENIPYTLIEGKDYKVLSVNWIKFKNERTNQILQILKLNSEDLEKKFCTYINNNELKPEWKENALNLIK